MMNALTPLGPAARSVAQKRTMRSAWGPLVIQFFEPLMTQWSPSFTATVCMCEASEPLAGSVRPKQPSFCPLARGVRNSFFWASLPFLRMGSQTRELFTDMITPVDAQARLTSSMASA
jgi:hypothetical protein